MNTLEKKAPNNLILEFTVIDSKGNDVVKTVRLNDIPIQMWTQVSIIVYDEEIIFYINGKLVKTFISGGRIKWNKDNKLVMQLNESLDLSTIYYKPFPDTHSDIVKQYNKGHLGFSLWNYIRPRNPIKVKAQCTKAKIAITNAKISGVVYGMKKAIEQNDYLNSLIHKKIELKKLLRKEAAAKTGCDESKECSDIPNDTDNQCTNYGGGNICQFKNGKCIDAVEDHTHYQLELNEAPKDNHEEGVINSSDNNKMNQSGNSLDASDDNIVDDAVVEEVNSEVIERFNDIVGYSKDDYSEF